MGVPGLDLLRPPTSFRLVGVPEELQARSIVRTVRTATPWLASAAVIAACGGEGGTVPLVCEMEARLLPGEVLSAAPTSSEPGCGLLLPSGAAGARYRVALLRPDSAAPDATSTVTLHVEGLGVEPTATTPALLSAPPPPDFPLDPLAFSSLQVAPGAREATGRFHEALRRGEAALVEALGTEGLLPTRAASLPFVAPSAAPSPARLGFDPGTSCSAARSERAAVLLGENEVIAIYQDSVEFASAGMRVQLDQVQRMLSFYAAHGKETVEGTFGNLPDVDGNGKILVVITAHAFSDDMVVAYVWAGNFFAHSSCPASDEAEIVYLNPARVRTMDRSEYVALGVLSHESQHLVSLYHRLALTRRRNSSTFLGHPSWIEEGRAELADELTSRRAWSTVQGPATDQRVGWDELRTLGFEGSRCCKPEAWGVALEAARTVWYLSSQPNGLAVTPAGAIQEADIRNGGWHFHRWLADAYGPASGSAAGAALFRALTDSLSASGIEGLKDRLGTGFSDLFEEFAAAVMLHGTAVPSGVRGFRTYDFVSLTGSLFGSGSQPPGRYPWPVTTNGTGAAAAPTRSLETASYTGPIGPTGLRIHDFTSNGTGVGGRITVSSTVPVRLVVVRLQ